MTTAPHATSGAMRRRYRLDEDFAEDAHGVWALARDADDQLAAFDYSDGEDVERYLDDALRNADDKSVFSDVLQSSIRDFATQYHLSSERGNLFGLLDIGDRQRILEIGSGCGAVSRYLGEKGGRVDAVEGSAARARLAALRCRDLDHVRTYHCDANALSLPDSRYDLVTFIGVLEYAGRYADQAPSHRHAVVDWLRRARKTLKADGVVVIAIENRTGLKYLHGAGEDHFAKPWIGLYDYEFSGSAVDAGLGEEIRTYTYREWQSILSEAGLAHSEFCLPFPDYKLPKFVVAEAFANAREQLGALLPMMHSSDHAGGDFHCSDETMVWRGFAESGRLAEFANSFFIVAATQADALANLRINDFFVGPQMARRSQYRTFTFKRKGQPAVDKLALREGVCTAAESMRPAVAFAPSASEFLCGESMQERWLKLVRLGGGWDELAKAMRGYADYLQHAFAVENDSAALIDALPSNLVDTGGEWRRIDHEWISREPLTIEFVLFRGIFYFLQNERAKLQRALAPASLPGAGRIVDLIDAAFAQCNLQLHHDLPRFIAREERIQHQIHGGRATGDIESALNSRLHRSPISARLYWSIDGENTTDNNSIQIGLDDSDAAQTIRFALPDGIRHFKYLKFDPSDSPGLFQIHALTLSAQDAAGDRQTLWRAKSGAAIVAACVTENLEFGGGDNVGDAARELFVATDAENFVLLDYAQLVPQAMAGKIAGGIELAVQMTCPRRRDYRALRDHYLEENAALNRAIKRFQEENETLQAVRKELALIKASRVWRIAEKGRVLIYQRLFRYIPWLQSLSLNVSRRGFRTIARELVSGRWRDAIDTPVEPLTRQVSPQLKRDSKFQEFQKQEQRVRQDQQAVALRIGAMRVKPKISLVMPVYNVDPKWLDQAIESVLAQSYEFWELCIVDDCSTNAATREYFNWISNPRIKTKALAENGNISTATNAAIEMTSGDYVGFLDHDDVLAPDALLEVAAAINVYDPDVLYSDEDFIDTNNVRSTPHFKPDYSPELLLSHNYITHFCVVRKPLISAVGGFRSAYDGAQDYDFLLRVTEKTDAIHHIAKILYHWRMIEESTSLNVDAKPAALERTRAALEDTMRRRGVEAEICNANLPFFFRTKFKISPQNGAPPLISIIVPFKDKPELLQTSVAKIAAMSTYPQFEIIGLSNNSQQTTTFDQMRRLQQQDQRIRFHEFNIPFNFSRLVNRGVELATGDYVVLFNNDVEIINWDWMEAMLEHAQRPEIGVVGGKLYFPDDSVQHAGVVVGIGGYAGHMHKKFASKRAGYFNRANLVQNISAVTGAFMMVSKSVYEEVGGFDEEQFAIACNDVDFCLRVSNTGRRNVFTPYAEAYHLESVSRGYEDNAEKDARFAAERSRFQERHRDILDKGDPFYNPNLALDSENFAIRVAGP